VSRHDEPLDTVAIAADDVALDMLAGDDAVSWDLADPALRALFALRDDVSHEMPVPNASWALTAVDLSPRAGRARRLGRRTVVASAVTAAVLSVSGVAAAAIESGPGATLYPIHRLLTGAQPTASERAVAQVRNSLRLADKDLSGGRLTAAGTALDHASTWLTRVDAKDRGDLPAALATLQAKYDAALAAAHGPSSTSGPGGNSGPGGGSNQSGENNGHGSSNEPGGTPNQGPDKSGEHQDSGNHGTHEGSGSSGDNHGTGGGTGSDHGGSSGIEGGLGGNGSVHGADRTSRTVDDNSNHGSGTRNLQS
jgi:hypothetical protein